jgi:hypothetical protein
MAKTQFEGLTPTKHVANELFRPLHNPCHPPNDCASRSSLKRHLPICVFLFGYSAPVLQGRAWEMRRVEYAQLKRASPQIYQGLQSGGLTSGLGPDSSAALIKIV